MEPKIAYTGYTPITQEKVMELPTQSKKLFIGIPKETSFQENRVALTPESVAVLVNNGHKVAIETKALSTATTRRQEPKLCTILPRYTKPTSS